MYLLWWVQHKHLSPVIVAAVLAAGDLAATALEVPTGRFADRYGHRRSLMFGSAMQVAGMLLFWLGEGVPGLLAASLAVALGDAFRSGADEALLYRSCAAVHGRANFHVIVARSHSLQLIALVALILIGGALVTEYGFTAAWIAETALAAMGLVIALAMAEPPAAGAAEDAPDDTTASQSPLSAWSVLQTVLPMVLPAALLYAAANATSFMAQTRGESDAGTLTLLVAGTTLVEALGAALSCRFRAHLRNLYLLLATGMACVAAMAAVQAAFLPGVVGLSFLAGVTDPLRTTAIQRASADGARAQTASWASAIDMSVSALAQLLAGVLPSRRGRM